VKLWTWHKPDFSLLKGRVEHERSEYVQSVGGVRDAYRELAARIGTDQFIWCYTVPNQRIISAAHMEVEWVLDVPPEAILRFVDDLVWNRILGIRCALPPSMRFTWKQQALRRFPNDITARRESEQQQEEAFWTQPPPSESWWDNLFVEQQAKQLVSALVRHPVEPEWVLSNPRVRD
jgi:hypothetical protein